MQFDIKFYPYVLIKRRKSLNGDSAQRLPFCNRLISTVNQNPDFFDRLIVSDEAMFSLNSEVNTRNVWNCAEHGNGPPPDQGANQPMVWVGLTRMGVVLGPHFAERNLDIREYMRIIRYNVIQRDFCIRNIDRNVMWWQQDGVPSHTSNATICE